MTKKVDLRSNLGLESMEFSLSFFEGSGNYCQIPPSPFEDFGMMMEKMSVFMAKIEQLFKAELRLDQVLGFSLRPFDVTNDRGETIGFEVDVTLGHQGKRGGVAIDQSLGCNELFLYPKGFIVERLRTTGGSGPTYSSAQTVAKMVVSILREQMKS